MQCNSCFKQHRKAKFPLHFGRRNQEALRGREASQVQKGSARIHCLAVPGCMCWKPTKSWRNLMNSPVPHVTGSCSFISAGSNSTPPPHLGPSSKCLLGLPLGAYGLSSHSQLTNQFKLPSSFLLPSSKLLSYRRQLGLPLGAHCHSSHGVGPRSLPALLFPINRRERLMKA